MTPALRSNHRTRSKRKNARRHGLNIFDQGCLSWPPGKLHNQPFSRSRKICRARYSRDSTAFGVASKIVAASATLRSSHSHSTIASRKSSGRFFTAMRTAAARSFASACSFGAGESAGSVPPSVCSDSPLSASSETFGCRDAPAEMVSSQIRGDGVKPGGKFFVRPKAGACAENADKSFLCQIVRVVFVAEHPAEKMKDRRRVAIHQIIERRVMAGGQPLHVRAVAGVCLPRRSLRRRRGVSWLHVRGRRGQTWIARFPRGNRA